MKTLAERINDVAEAVAELADEESANVMQAMIVSLEEKMSKRQWTEERNRPVKEFNRHVIYMSNADADKRNEIEAIRDLALTVMENKKRAELRNKAETTLNEMEQK